MFVKGVPSASFTSVNVFMVASVFPTPHAPPAFAPVAHTLPSALNTLVKLNPCSTCGIVIVLSVFLVTYIVVCALYPCKSSVTIIVVSPSPFAVTFPFSSTTAISSFVLFHVKFPYSGAFTNTFKFSTVCTCNFLVSPIFIYEFLSVISK